MYSKSADYLLVGLVLMVLLVSFAAVLSHGYSTAVAAVGISSCLKIDKPGYYILEKDVSGVSENKFSCISIVSDGVVLDGRGFTVSGFSEGAGVEVKGSGSVIKNVKVVNYRWGVTLVWPSSRNTIANNTISRNVIGLYIPASLDNSILGNIVEGNIEVGVYVESPNNTIAGNTFTDNAYEALRIEKTTSNAVVNNTFRGNDWSITVIESSNNTLIGNTLAGNQCGLNLVNSSSNLVALNELVSNNHNIVLDKSSSNLVVENRVKNGSYGISLFGSSSNTVARNTVAGNGYGIYLEESSNNTIYLNYFLSNTYNYKCVLCEVGNSQRWFSLEPLKYFYRGKEYVSYLGNYWSNYSGPDRNGDGVGDEPHVLDDANRDPFPLVAASLDYKFPELFPTTPISTTLSPTLTPTTSTLVPQTTTTTATTEKTTRTEGVTATSETRGGELTPLTILLAPVLLISVVLALLVRKTRRK
ncbi:MAG: NosD domain-containing protein [Sulfolobales archaeon]